MKLNELTAHKLHDLIVARKVSALEVTEAVLKRIEEVGEKVNAYVAVLGEEALKEARSVDQAIARGEKIFPLTGIPLAIKDNMCLRGAATTCASKILHNFHPPYDATVIDRLRKEKAIFLGKTNMDEFAMGSSTETSHFGVTHNPWDLSTVPGGSSGGSTAAVAADETIIALGSDTGGSIRQPAAFCGVVGMKPTYGLVSRYGLVAFASSLDQIGPITKDVTDAAYLMNSLSGHDPKDSTSVNPVRSNPPQADAVRRRGRTSNGVPDYTQALINDVKGLRIGIPREYFGEGIEAEVRKAIEKSIQLLKEWGAELKETSLPHTEYAIATYYLIATAEASSNLARYDGVQYGYRVSNQESVTSNLMIDIYERTRAEGFGDEVKRRIMLGTYGLSAGYYEAYYRRAQKVRTLIKEDFNRAFKEFDCLLTPTSPTVAFKIGEKMDDPLKMYLSDIFTISVNLAGVPALTIPCGFTEEGLPIGLQLIARPFAEETLFRIAYTFEQNTDFHKRKCKL
ncbi:Asp-tRNA(Asn)/Glu-tRNA(Gln) amidotransferase subunit GatA [candidate division NPL-UPA2 bacterium]|nr:Asp-tRNA(Asn)/Glu-tRNA(Gln) amidotransferase subunit GatA [candidate division NPL-UPA2 bacterium]